MSSRVVSASETRASPQHAELTVVDIDASHLDRHPDLLGEMFRGERLGAVIRSAFPADAMATVVARLERGECLLKRHPATHFKGLSYGGIIIVADELLDSYLEEGAQFREACATLFEGAPDYQTRIEELLGSLGGGRRVSVPLGPDTRPYIASSIRGVVEGGQIDLHCENETLGFPGMRHLSTLIDGRDQLSFYLTLARPGAGGEICISKLRFAEGPGKALLRMDRKSHQTLRAIFPYGTVIPDVNAGDLLIFDAGRHFHRVAAVTGSRTRWTMGGFLALSSDHQQIYYWS